MARTKAELQFDTFADFPLNWSANILYIATDTLVAYIWDWNSYEAIWWGWWGSWDVTWPASATDWVPALFNWTTWKLLKNSTPTGTWNPVLQTSPTLTTPRFSDNWYIADSSGNEMVLFNENPSAVNYLEIENGVTGIPPHLRASWDDTNIGLHLVGKGTWEVSVCDPTDETKRLRFWVSNNGTGIITTLRSNSTGASKTIDLPNASGTVALTSDLSNYAPLSGATFTGNISTPNLIEWFRAQATAGGITTLVSTDAYTQEFTGTTTQTVILPTTGVVAWQSFIINNQSTWAVTIQSSWANTIVVLAWGCSAMVTAMISTPTTATNWTFDTSLKASATTTILVGWGTTNSPVWTTATGSGAPVRATSPTLATSVVWSSTMAVFNTTSTTVNAFWASTTMTVWGTPTTAITHSYSANATATATTKTVNLWTGGAVGSTSNINIGSSNGGTTTINSPNTSLWGVTGVSTTGTIELWHTSDTTLSRVSAWVIAVEWVVIPSISSTDTLTNKTMTWSTNILTASLLKSATTEINVSSATAPTTWQVLTATSWTTATWQTPSGVPKELRITIPWEQIADINAYQGMYFKNTSGNSWTITNVAVSVAKAAAWSGAVYSINVYKSSGTASDWINTSAVNLFTSAIALWTGNDSLTNVPNTTTVENGRWLSLRVTSSEGATNKASNLQVVITLA